MRDSKGACGHDTGERVAGEKSGTLFSVSEGNGSNGNGANGQPVRFRLNEPEPEPEPPKAVTYKSVFEKIRCMVDADLDAMAVEHEGSQAPLQERRARRLTRYAKAMVALQNAEKLKDAHGEDCECSRCKLEIMTAERELETRIRERYLVTRRKSAS